MASCLATNCGENGYALMRVWRRLGPLLVAVLMLTPPLALALALALIELESMTPDDTGEEDSEIIIEPAG